MSDLDLRDVARNPAERAIAHHAAALANMQQIAALVDMPAKQVKLWLERLHKRARLGVLRAGERVWFKRADGSAGSGEVVRWLSVEEQTERLRRQSEDSDWYAVKTAYGEGLFARERLRRSEEKL